MTAIFHRIGGREYVMRNFLEFKESFSENIKKFENEAGSSIVYPVRCGKRRISAKIECNSVYLAVLKEILSSPIIHLKYTHGSDAECNCIGDVKQKVHEVDFIKSSDISIKQIADTSVKLPNRGMYSDMGYYDIDGRGAYEVSVTLEEV